MTPQLQTVQLLAVLSVFSSFALAEWLQGRFFAREATPQDNRLDVAVTLLFPLIGGAVLAASGAVCAWLMPAQQNALAHWPVWAMVAVLLVADDLTQYLWHRLSHTSVLWPLHRAHHSAAYMSVRIVYRNNAFYYALMPGIWLSGVLLFLGFGWVYVGYTIVKLTVIIGAHSSVRWDQWLYRRAALRPLAWVLQRVISTPATHFAHHALVQDDGIGHYTGNYGNLLFIWDVLFGTARITQQYPPAFGLADDREHGAESWLVQFIYPLLRSRRPGTVLGSEGHLPVGHRAKAHGQQVEQVVLVQPPGLAVTLLGQPVGGALHIARGEVEEGLRGDIGAAGRGEDGGAAAVHVPQQPAEIARAQVGLQRPAGIGVAEGVGQVGQAAEHHALVDQQLGQVDRLSRRG